MTLNIGRPYAAEPIFVGIVNKNAIKIILVHTKIGLRLWAYCSRDGSYGLVLAWWMRGILYGLLLPWIINSSYRKWEVPSGSSYIARVPYVTQKGLIIGSC